MKTRQIHSETTPTKVVRTATIEGYIVISVTQKLAQGFATGVSFCSPDDAYDRNEGIARAEDRVYGDFAYKTNTDDLSCLVTKMILAGDPIVPQAIVRKAKRAIRAVLN